MISAAFGVGGSMKVSRGWTIDGGEDGPDCQAVGATTPASSVKRAAKEAGIDVTSRSSETDVSDPDEPRE
jgi:hypothetical protein